MALKNYFMILALLASVFVTNSAYGQINLPGPRFSPKPVEQPDATGAFAEPGIFDYDTQMFAPLEFTNGKQPDPATGFYFTFDKTYLHLNSGGRTSTNGNYMWGNRYDLGWMTDGDEGWGIMFQNSSGSEFFNGNDALVSQPMHVETGFSTFQLNKIYRQQLKSGDYFEPYIGIRYMNINDETIEDTTQPVAGTPSPNRFKQNVSNDAFGLHAGGRHIRNRGRFRTTTNMALSTLYNQQELLAQDILTVGGVVGISQSTASDQAFVPVLDFSHEISYHVSRDIAFRTGVLVMYLWDGIVRADTATTLLNGNSVFSGAPQSFDADSTLSAGFTFGFEWNR